MDNTTHSSDIVVSGTSGTVCNIVVNLLGLTHTFLGDLTCTLTHVDTGTVVDLFRSCGGGSDLNGNYSFADAYTGNICTAGGGGLTPPGNYHPKTTGAADSFFSAFNGELMNGTWRLSITDGAPGDQGALTSWELCLTQCAPSSSSSSQSQFIPSCINVNCGGCQVMPNEFQLVVSGVTNGTCTNCSQLNGTFTLKYNNSISNCSWETDAVNSDCGTSTPIWNLRFSILAGWRLYSYDDNVQLSCANFDCTGTNNFVSFAGTDCNVTGATATLTPLIQCGSSSQSSQASSSQQQQQSSSAAAGKQWYCLGSSSMSSSSMTYITSCCGGASIPSTLHVSISGGCACINGTFTATYVAAYNAWRTNIGNFDVVLVCGGVGFWVLEDTYLLDGTQPPAVCKIGSTFASPTTCSPFDITFPTSQAGNTCPCCANATAVTLHYTF